MTVNKEKLKGIEERFREFHRERAHFFKTKTRDNTKVSRQYVDGLVQARKRNMERMTESVPDSDEQALQHFITNSPWDEKPVLKHHSQEADKILGGREDSCLLIDETAFPKKGKKSVGVARQWCGRLGKIDNCQVAVFAALALKERSVPIDFRLYLPEEWTSNKQRCLAAGIPQSEIRFKTKPELAIEMVIKAKESGLQFNWVGADAFYGKDPKFIQGLFDIGMTFVVDVQKSQTIFIKDPTSGIESQPMSVENWASSQSKAAWKRVKIRSSTKGQISADILHTKAWIRVGQNGRFKRIRVLIKRSVQGDDIKYSISNAPDSVTIERLVYMQSARFWIERAFEDAKDILGMDEYQLRKWRGWQHHMTLVLMAQLFLLQERLVNAEAFPLLSCRDIMILLAHYLPRRDVAEGEILRQLEIRHQKRKEAIERSKGKTI